MEESGVPSVGIVTEQFSGLALATARGRKMPDLNIIVLPHKYDQLSEQEVREDIRGRAAEIIGTLTDS